MAYLFYKRKGRRVAYDKRTGLRLFDADRFLHDYEKRHALRVRAEYEQACAILGIDPLSDIL